MKFEETKPNTYLVMSTNYYGLINDDGSYPSFRIYNRHTKLLQQTGGFHKGGLEACKKAVMEYLSYWESELPTSKTDSLPAENSDAVKSIVGW